MKVSSAIKSFVKSDYSVVLSFDLIAKALVAVVTILLVRMLSKEDYATYTNFSEVAGIFLSIVGTGLSIPYVTYSAEQNSRGKGSGDILFNTCCILTVCITFVAMLFTPVVASVYNLSISLTLLAFVYGGLQSQNKLAQSYFQSKSEFKKSGYVTNFKNISLLVFVFAVFVIFEKASGVAAAIVTVASAAVAFVACVVWIWKDNRTASLQTSGLLLKKLLSESKWLILYLIFQSLFSSVCLVILNQYGTRSDVANYGVASKYYSLFLMFLASLHTVLRVKTNQKEMVDSAEKRRDFSVNWVKKVFPLILFVVGVAEICSGFVLPFLNGDGYTDAIGIFRILLVAVFFGYLFSPNTAILIAAKKHKFLLVLAVISCIVGGTICYFLLPFIGVKVAAISIVTSNLILNGTGFYAIQRKY